MASCVSQLPRWLSGKESACQCRRHRFDSWVRKILCGEEEVASCSSILAWQIPWTEELGRLQSMGSQRVGHDQWLNACTHTHICVYTLNNQVTRGVDTVSTLCSHSHWFASLSSLFQKLRKYSKCMHACSVASVVSNSVRSRGLQPTRLFCPWNSSGKNTGMDCCAVLQGSVVSIQI